MKGYRIFGLIITILGILLIFYGTEQYRKDKRLVIKGDIIEARVIDGDNGLFDGVLKYGDKNIRVPLSYDEYENYSKHGSLFKTYNTNTFDYYQDFNELHPGTDESVIMDKTSRVIILSFGFILLALGLIIIVPELLEIIIYIPLILIEGID